MSEFLKPTLRVKCPVCLAMVEWTEQQHFRPFCSERCKMIDLGDWATEAHSIPGHSLDDGSEEVG